ncbi:uncharacterized protein [Ambystoma mexicanum]
MEGTRFIAFKVPLKGVINQRLSPNQKFTPKDLIAEIRAQGEELGLVIDLTNTNRYYEVKDLPKGVSYQKLPTAGLEVPDDDAILQFKKIVRKFLRQNQHNDKLVGVHCTTGLSRTGYLICRYLVDVDEWNPDVAMKGFQESRGLPLDGRVYVADLKVGKKRTNEGIDDCDPDEDVGPVAVPQYNDPSRTQWPSHGAQTWDNLEQRNVEDATFMSRGNGERITPFPDDGYGVLHRPEHRLRSTYGRLPDEDIQESKHYGEEFQRPAQRSEPFPGDQYDFESGRSRDLYSGLHGQRLPHDGMSYGDLKGQTPLLEKPLHSSWSEQRMRSFPGESREFRDGGSQDLYDMPSGQRPRSHLGYAAQDEFTAPSRAFPSERAHESFDSTTGQRPSYMHEFKTERQTEDGYGNRGRALHGRDSLEGDFPNVGPTQGPRRLMGSQSHAFDTAAQIEDDFPKRGYQQRPQPYGHPSSLGMQNDGPVEDRPYPERDFGQRPLYGPQSRDSEIELNLGKHEISYSENQRMRLPPVSRSPLSKMAPGMEDLDYNNGPSRRGVPYRDFAAHDLQPERNMEDGGFSGGGPGQRPRAYLDQQMEMRDRGYIRPGPRPFEGQTKSNFPPEPLSESGPSYPGLSKRMRLPDDLNQGDRFSPYASHSQPPPLAQADNPRRYERMPLDRSGEGTSAFDYSHGVADQQKYATEGSFRERTGLPRKSRFN